MAKDRDNRRREERAPASPVLPPEDPGPPPMMIAGQPVGKYVFSAGLLALFVGFVLLAGQHLTSAPLLIIGGLVVIFIGLWHL